MIKTKTVTVNSDHVAETLVFIRRDYVYTNDQHRATIRPDFEVCIEDAYCRGNHTGIKARFKRAWNAFFAKPVTYAGVYTEDKDKMIKWLEDSLAVMKEENFNDRT